MWMDSAKNVFFSINTVNEPGTKRSWAKQEQKKKNASAANIQLLPSISLSWRLEYDRELIFKLSFVFYNHQCATLFTKSLSFTATFLIVWNRVYASCNPYAHTICINNGKEKKWRRTWQIYRFGSAHPQFLSSFAIRPMETKPLLALKK